MFHRINTHYRNLSCSEPKSSKFSMLFVTLAETHCLQFLKHMVRLFTSALPTFIHTFSCVNSVYTEYMDDFTENFENAIFYTIICIIIQIHNNNITYCERQKNSSYSLFYAQIHQMDNSCSNP